ncbi:ATP-binding protein [Solimonas soli]|uniref:ATP-binding protein n=1 Tax=Solimonas soli TaxID=413479 RepID=UPI00048785DB|nr:ATP-binding protein [Solimonas soli]
MSKPESEAEAVRQARLWRIEKRRLELLGQLSAGFAHELNNLLAVISNSSYLLRRIDDEARRAALLQKIEAATRRGAELTRRLPNIGRENGRGRMVMLQEVAGELEDLVRHVVRSNIRLRLDLPAELWPVAVDYGELQLALLQLAMNAREAMPDGGSLRLQARNRALETIEAGRLMIGAGEYVELSVADSGCGLPPETLQRARDAAAGDERAHEERGLVQVCSFVRRARGALEAASDAGAGTVIQLVLPRARPPMPASSS